ncbi:MAG: TonB-dependent receptor [Henriciella sp.]
MSQRNSNSFSTQALFTSVGVTALLALTSGPVSAQEEASEETPESTRTLSTVEVTATRREGVTVQDVPVSITAFDAETLVQADFNRLNDLEQLSPSVQITQGQSAAAGTSISIRGIGTNASNFGFEPAVGVFVDGVFRTRTGAGLQELTELAGVEVLRGPQGTLFGRNTSAGVVSMRTQKPTFETTGYASISSGNYNSLEATAGISGAFSENVAGRIDGKIRQRDGFITEVNTGREFNNIDRLTVRGQLLFEGQDSSLRLIADYTETDEDCCVPLIEQIGDFGPLVQATAAANGLIGNIDPAVRGDDFEIATSPNRGYRDDVEDFGLSAEFNKDLTIGKFTSITAYRDFSSIRDQDIDFSGADRTFRDGTTNDDTQFTQEFRLQGVTGNIDWLVGVFYLNEQIETYDTIQYGADTDVFTDFSFARASTGQIGVPLSLYGTNLSSGAIPFFFTDRAGLLGLGAGAVVPFAAVPPAGPARANFTPFLLPATPLGSGGFDRFTQDTDALALFTHNEIALSDRLTLTAGLRYNWERKEIEADLNGDVPGCSVLQAPGTTAWTQVPSLSPLSPFVAFANLFACNPVLSPEFLVVDGDTESREDSQFTGTVKLGYELSPDILLFGGYSRGFKSGGFNLDRSSLESTFNNTLLGIPTDGPQLSDLAFDEETVDAFEVGVKSSWMDGRMTVNATAFYSETKGFQENTFVSPNFIVFNNDVEAQGIELDVGASPMDGLVLQGAATYVKAERTNEDAANPNQQLGNTPEWVWTGQGTYTFPIFEGFEGTLHANIRYQTETNLVQGDALEAFDNDAFATVGARAGIQTEGGGYAVSIFGSNIFDEGYNLTAIGVPQQNGTIAVFPGEPRFWGVELRARF